MRKESIRNIAIIAHVDHGKTTLVDGLLKQSGTFKEHQNVEDRVMDSMDLEKERGITITAKNTAVYFQDIKINILDTPGHAAFTEMRARGSKLTDVVVLVVAANDGVKPQTVESIKHAKAAGVPIVVAINKCDLPDADPQKVKNQLLEHELIAEELSGETLMVEISTKNKKFDPNFHQAMLEIEDIKPNFLLGTLY